MADRPGGPLAIDPHTSNFLAVFGRKGEGKSVLANRFWTSWPYDRLMIDVAGDDWPRDDETKKLTSPLPSRWPTPAEDQRVSLRFVPDPGSPTYSDDVDRAVGLAYNHPKHRCLLVVHEIHEVAPVHRTGPHMRRVLKQGRHVGLNLVMAGPRPVEMDPLVLANADLIAAFSLANPNDRRRVADSIGRDPKEVDRAFAALDTHEFLLYNARTNDLVHCPPLPSATKTVAKG